MNYSIRDLAQVVGIRMVKTFCESIGACLALGVPIYQMEWLEALTISAGAAVLTGFWCLAKTPNEVLLGEKATELDGLIGKDAENDA